MILNIKVYNVAHLNEKAKRVAYTHLVMDHNEEPFYNKTLKEMVELVESKFPNLFYKGDRDSLDYSRGIHITIYGIDMGKKLNIEYQPLYLMCDKLFEENPDKSIKEIFSELYEIKSDNYALKVFL